MGSIRSLQTLETLTETCKMLKLTAVLLSLTAALAQECGPCMPGTYQGVIGQSNLVAVGEEVFPSMEGAFMARDENANRAAGYINTDEGKQLAITINYDSETMYVAETDSETCSRVAFKGKLSSACLEDFSEVSRVRLGGGGNSMGAVVVTGTISNPSVGLEAGITIIANPATCLPVSAGGAGTIRLAPGLEVPIAFGQSYFDMEAEVSDQAVLYPPAYCEGAPEKDLDEALESTEVSFVFNWFTERE